LRLLRDAVDTSPGLGLIEIAWSVGRRPRCRRRRGGKNRLERARPRPSKIAPGAGGILVGKTWERTFWAERTEQGALTPSSSRSRPAAWRLPVRVPRTWISSGRQRRGPFSASPLSWSIRQNGSWPLRPGAALMYGGVRPRHAVASDFRVYFGSANAPPAELLYSYYRARRLPDPFAHDDNPSAIPVPGGGERGRGCGDGR